MSSAVIGQLAALSAACLWAIATLFYHRAGSHFSALQMNWLKGLVASPLLFVGVWWLDGQLRWDVQHALLALSGIIGITIGDSCHFSALRRLGPWHAMLMEYLAPPIAAFLAWFYLSDPLSPSEQPPLSMVGLLFGAGAAVCQATGLVLAFAVLMQSDIIPVQAAFTRMSAGALLLCLIVLVPRWGQLPQLRSKLRHVNPMPLVIAILLGTVAAIWLQQVSIAHVNPGLTQTLLSTAPLFLIPISLLKKQRISLRSVLGALISFAGIGLLFL